VVAAGMEKNVVMLDMRKILSQSEHGAPSNAISVGSENAKMKLNQKSSANGQHVNGMNLN
jgi:hypothetical protein